MSDDGQLSASTQPNAMATDEGDSGAGSDDAFLKSITQELEALLSRFRDWLNEDIFDKATLKRTDDIMRQLKVDSDRSEFMTIVPIDPETMSKAPEKMSLMEGALKRYETADTIAKFAEGFTALARARKTGAEEDKVKATEKLVSAVADVLTAPAIEEAVIGEAVLGRFAQKQAAGKFLEGGVEEISSIITDIRHGDYQAAEDKLIGASIAVGIRIYEQQQDVKRWLVPRRLQ